jgi:3-phenylpropionate/trans-cinnamate dioxygenase subunit alpha
VRDRPPIDVRSLVDASQGFITASVYCDEDIYQLELERIFARCWLFLGHESTIPKAGDYVTAYMGEDPVIVVRQKDGSVGAFLNQCRHRGMKICRADAGNARTFTCTYHGWTYDIAGNLVSVPHEQRGYHGQLDRSRFGARRVPRLHSYRGLIFGCWDEAAMPFSEYLGDMAWYLDSLADRCERTSFVPGVTRWVVECNWKYPSEQFASDMYHVEGTHVSSLIAQMPEDAPPGASGFDPTLDGLQFSSPHGHGAGFFLERAADLSAAGAVAEYVTETMPTAIDRLGELRATSVRGHNTVFPNFSYLIGTNIIRVWHPRGPGAMEVWSWTMVDDAAPGEVRAAWREGAIRTFSPAGIFEQDDGENWKDMQKVLRGHVARQTRLNATMGAGHAGPHDEVPGRVSDVFSEEAARGFYGYWAELMERP